MARAAVGLLAIDEDRQYVFAVMHQILLLLPRVVELDVSSLHTLISAVLTVHVCTFMWPLSPPSSEL